VLNPALGDDGGTGRRQPLGGNFQGLVDHLGGKAGQQRRDHADLAHAIGRDAQQRRLDARERGVARGAGRSIAARSNHRQTGSLPRPNWR